MDRAERLRWPPARIPEADLVGRSSASRPASPPGVRRRGRTRGRRRTRRSPCARWRGNRPTDRVSPWPPRCDRRTAACEPVIAVVPRGESSALRVHERARSPVVPRRHRRHGSVARSRAGRPRAAPQSVVRYASPDRSTSAAGGAARRASSPPRRSRPRRRRRRPGARPRPRRTGGGADRVSVSRRRGA